MRYASEDYSSNMSGSSYVNQFLKKKKKKEEKEEGMSCSEHGCAAYNSGGGGSDAGTVSYKGGSSNPAPGSKGESNKVLTKKQADKRAEEFEKKRKNAPAMNTLTKNQIKAQSAMGPPAPKK